MREMLAEANVTVVRNLVGLRSVGVAGGRVQHVVSMDAARSQFFSGKCVATLVAPVY